MFSDALMAENDLRVLHASKCLNGQQTRGKGKDRKFTTPILPVNEAVPVQPR
jgi:hypothetical protein